MSSPELRGQAVQFIESVLALKPALAVFDCDGTLWSGDAGADFFYWEIERGLVDGAVAEWARARYEEYKAGKVNEEQMCGEMVIMNRGISHEALQRAAAEFFDEVVSPRVFPEMQELTRGLTAQGCDVWAVSSTNNWVVEVGAAHFGIAPDHVLAACVHLDGGGASDRLIRVPTDEVKALAIRRSLASRWTPSSATPCTIKPCSRWRGTRFASIPTLIWNGSHASAAGRCTGRKASFHEASEVDQLYGGGSKFTSRKMKISGTWRIFWRESGVDSQIPRLVLRDNRTRSDLQFRY